MDNTQRIDGATLKKLATINSMYANGMIEARTEPETCGAVGFKIPLDLLLPILQEYDLNLTLKKTRWHVTSLVKKGEIK